MKKRLRSNIVCVMSVIFMIGCSTKQNNDQREEYTCPMHPQIVQYGPGRCPICKMDLVLRSPQQKAVGITPDLAHLLKPANIQVTSSIKTVTPVRKPLEVEVKARGIIVHDTRRLGAIASRVAGRIEKLSIKSNWQPVYKGQKIMEIYSPELVSAQQEFLFAMQPDKENTFLVDAAKEKLLLLGLSTPQIERLIRTGKASRTLDVYSPMDGYITTTHTEQPEANDIDPRMQDETSIKEGMYVTSGQEVFTVVSHKDLWAEFDIYQSDVSTVSLHDTAVITVDNSYGNVTAQVDRVQPGFDGRPGFTKVRMRLMNPHHQYHAGQQVTAVFKSKTDTLLWIPITANIDLGSKRVVLLKSNKTFRPLEISTGQRSGDWIQVRTGLTTDDSIAYNASFLIDSEDFVKIIAK